MARKKDLETYQRRLERLEWYRKLCHQNYSVEWIHLAWISSVQEISKRIERSGFDVPICWRCKLEDEGKS